MAVAVKYNHDRSFRRRVAFYRMYRAKDFKKRFQIEMIALAIFALASVLLWFLGGDTPYLIYVFYFAVVLTLYLLVRLLRAGMVALRVKEGDESLRDRTFVFDERGFSFGPVDAAGKLIETRWRDIDRAYILKDAVYFLAMGRRHWAAVDKRLVTEGTWDELLILIRKNLPKRQIVE